MKRWFKWLFLLLAVLLCIGGGLFLWQMRIFRRRRVPRVPKGVY